MIFYLESKKDLILYFFITDRITFLFSYLFHCKDIFSKSLCFYKYFLLQAAHAVLQQQETGKPVYKVKNVSLNTLCRAYNAPINPRKDQVS